MDKHNEERLLESILALEKRVSVLEGLINDIMIQLDNPTRDQSLGDSKDKKKPVTKNNVKNKVQKRPQTERTLENNAKQQEASKQKLEAEIQRVENYLSDGDKYTREEILEDCDLSKKAFNRVIKAIDIQSDKNPDMELRLYWSED